MDYVARQKGEPTRLDVSGVVFSAKKLRRCERASVDNWLMKAESDAKNQRAIGSLMTGLK